MPVGVPHVFDGILFTARCPLNLPQDAVVMVAWRKTTSFFLAFRMHRVALATKFLGLVLVLKLRISISKVF
jgi:hypothetical protein